MTQVSPQARLIFFIALAIRIAAIIFGACFDQIMFPLQYTDIDYHVYTEAANFMMKGMAPYEMQTYRYPPVLAALLIPNHILHRAFGKILFAIFDSLLIFEIDQIHKVSPVTPWKGWLSLWCYNPISIYICSRGSADSISNYLVLMTLRLFIVKQFSASGIIFATSVYFRIYPIIYLPSFLYSLFQSSNSTKIINILTFGINFTLTLAGLVIISYSLYGEYYMEHAIYYHTIRKDHRHNFSPFFYPTYLHLSQTNNNNNNINNKPSKIDNLLSFIQFNISTLSQIILLLVITMKFAGSNLAKCMLLQTLVFVTFNKVMTGQYFLWYIILLPVTLDWKKIMIYQRTVLMRSSLWIISLFGWLYCAYLLEFQGQNTFLMIWIMSIIFLFANICLILMINQVS
jgi:GPI mannosyltransferase 1 subunit M